MMRISYLCILVLACAENVRADDPFGNGGNNGSPPAPPASCFTFEAGATCLSISAETGLPSVEGASAVTCSITQTQCALTFACDEGAGVAEGTINGNVLTITNSVGVSATIADDGALTFNDGIFCAPPPTEEEAGTGSDSNGPTDNGNGAGEVGDSAGGPATLAPATTTAFAAGNSLTTCSLPGSDSLPCGGPCEDGVCKAGECLVLPAGLGSACTVADGSTGVCASSGTGPVCEKPPPAASCDGQADTTPCAVSNQCEKGLCFGSTCLSTPQSGVPCTAEGGVQGLCTADSEQSSAPVCVEDPNATLAPVATTDAATAAPLAEDGAPYVTQCSGATSGATCLSGPCTLGLCAQSYCVPLAFVEDSTPCGNGEGVCTSGQCAPANPAGPAVTTQLPTTAAHFDANALKSVVGYDAPGSIRILGSLSIKGISLAQVQIVSILQRAISFTLQLVAHDTLLPDPAVDLVAAVLSGASSSEGLVNVDFSVVKLFGTPDELARIIKALSDVDNAAYFFAQQSAAATLGASVASVSVVSSSIVAQPEVVTTEARWNTTMRPAVDQSVPGAGTSGGLVILACTFAFLIVAAGIIAWRHKNVGRDSFEVARKPVVPVDEYVPQDSYITVKNRGAYLRSEPLATAENFVSARHPLNRMKNRSADHLPYDASRVMLHESNDAPLPCSDYINASYVPGFGGRTYIATQGPVESTCVDFWRMVCEQACSTVVCMTSAEEGTAQQTAEYWPEQKDSPVTFGPFTITLEEVTKNEQADAVVRKLVVQVAEAQTADDTFVLEPKHLGKSFQVSMWQYLGFAEKFTPVDPTSLIAFRNAVREDVGDEAEKPTVVHCNNGCGRTGVFIVLDLEMDRHTKENRQVDLYESVVAVRRSRPQLVDSKQQYVFLHRAFIDQLLTGPNQVLAADLPAAQKMFLKHVAVSPAVRQDMPSFDIGLPGRKMLHMGQMELSSADAFHPVALVIMSDIVVLCQVDGDARIVIAVGRRDTAVVKKDVKGSNSSEDTSLFFRVKLGDDVCTFKVASAEEKTTWVERLLDTETGFAEPVMNGDRLVAKKPQFRRDALAIMQCPDPQSKEGSDEIKSEFGTIPLVFHAGPRSPTKAISGGQPRAIYMRGQTSASGLAAGFGSPAQALRTNNFFKSAGSPGGGSVEQSQANPSVMFGSQQSPGSAGGAASKVPTLGYRTNASVRAMPGLMLRATETVLAAKLGELEAAIEEAAKLEYIANGGEISPPRGRPPPLFIDLDEETETEGLPAMRESYVAANYDIESLPTSPIRPSSPTRSVSPTRSSPMRSPMRASPSKRLSGLWKSAGTKVVRRSAAAERFAKGMMPVTNANSSKGDFSVRAMPSMPKRRKPDVKKETPAVQPTTGPQHCTYLANCTCPDCV